MLLKDLVKTKVYVHYLNILYFILLLLLNYEIGASLFKTMEIYPFMHYVTSFSSLFLLYHYFSSNNVTDNLWSAWH